MHPVLSGIVCAIQINTFYQVWSSISARLTQWENCYTDYEYSNALYIKRIVFQFFNAYMYLFYVVFMTSKELCLQIERPLGEKIYWKQTICLQAIAIQV